MTDVKTLIFRAQAGDDQAFADLMRTHYAFVYAIVIGIVDNPQDTEEIVQDVFVNTYRGLAQYEERTKFRSWLAKIARNRALNWTRDQRIENVSINELHEHKLQTPDALADQLIRAEQRVLIRDALETLSPKDRELTRSYYLDGASYEELIRTHGLSYKAISVRLSRAKRKLSKRLRHLLTGVFVSPTATLKQVYSGGLTVMKVGTVYQSYCRCSSHHWARFHRDSPFHIVEGRFVHVGRDYNINIGTPKKIYSKESRHRASTFK